MMPEPFTVTIITDKDTYEFLCLPVEMYKCPFCGVADFPEGLKVHLLNDHKLRLSNK